LLDNLLDSAVCLACKHPVARSRLQVGQHGTVDPGSWTCSHGIGERPEQIAPRDDLAQHRLIAAEVLRSGGAQRLGNDPDQKIELDREPRAALELIAGQESRLREENLQLFEI